MNAVADNGAVVLAIPQDIPKTQTRGRGRGLKAMLVK